MTIPKKMAGGKKRSRRVGGRTEGRVKDGQEGREVVKDSESVISRGCCRHGH